MNHLTPADLRAGTIYETRTDGRGPVRLKFLHITDDGRLSFMGATAPSFHYIDPADIESGRVVVTLAGAGQAEAPANLETGSLTDNDYRVAARRTYESETIDIPLDAKVRDGDWQDCRWVECWVFVDDDNAALQRIASGEDPS